jgi:hypothetical protein
MPVASSSSKADRGRNDVTDDDDDVSVSSVSIPDFKDDDNDDSDGSAVEHRDSMWKFAYDDKIEHGRVSPIPGLETKVRQVL